MIYFINDTNYVKIGYSKTPYERLKSLQTGNPNLLKFMYVFPGTLQLEKKLHNYFKKNVSPAGNEWFDISDIHIENYFKDKDVKLAKHQARLLNLKSEGKKDITIKDVNNFTISKKIIEEVKGIIKKKEHRISYSVLSQKYNIDEKAVKYYIRSASLQKEVFDYNAKLK